MSGERFDPLMSAVMMPSKPEILICKSCQQGRGAAEFADQVATALDRSDQSAQFAVREVDCMNGCDAPISLALQGAGLATYFFGGIDAGEDLEDIISTCRAYRQSPAGWIEDARVCGKLRLKLQARVPALTPPVT